MTERFAKHHLFKNHGETGFSTEDCSLQYGTKNRHRKEKNSQKSRLWLVKGASIRWKVSCCNHLKAGLDDFLCSVANSFPMSQPDHSAGDPLCRGNGHLGGQDKVRLLLF